MEDTVQSLIPSYLKEQAIDSKPVWVRRNNVRQDALSVACILDNLSMTSYAPEANFFQLSMKNWENELGQGKPDLLFVESAWRGEGGAWWNEVQRCGSELRGIVEWCRSRSVPTVFWNKEDPVHFATFLNAASLFDVVFTTDVDCIPKYRAALGHSRVHFLPFAAQPLFHNPSEEFDRLRGCSFAGAYYQKYAERNRDFSALVPAIEHLGRFDIYDRNFGTEDETQRFPGEFHHQIVGHLTPVDIRYAYKGYEFSLNLNSVKHSQSMFARRVFELLASNTGVISNYSRGLSLMFGDLVLATDGTKELQSRISDLNAVPNGAERLRQMGVRKVFREHTYKHRFAEICRRAGLGAIDHKLGRVILISFVDSPELAERMIRVVERQTYKKIDLLLVGADLGTVTSESIEFSVARDLQEARDALSDMECDFIGYLDPASWYGADYVYDIVDVFQWAQVTRVGHAERFKVVDGGVERQRSGSAWTVCSDVSMSASLMSSDAQTFVDKYGLARDVKAYAFAVSTLEYCEGGAGVDPALLEPVRTLAIDTGLSWDDFQNYGEALNPEEENPAASPDSFVSISEIFRNSFANDELSVQLQDDGSIEVISAMPPGKSLEIHSEPEDAEVYGDLLKTPVFVQCTSPELDYEIAMIYLDESGARVGHQMLKLKRANQLSVPITAKKVQFGIRAKGPGDSFVLGLHIASSGDRKLSAEHLFGSSGLSGKVSYSLGLGGSVQIHSDLEPEQHQYVYGAMMIDLDEHSLDSGSLVSILSPDSGDIEFQVRLAGADSTIRRITPNLVCPVPEELEPDDIQGVVLKVEGPAHFTLGNIFGLRVNDHVPAVLLLGNLKDGPRLVFSSNSSGGVEVESKLIDGAHEYSYNDQLLPPFMLPENSGDEVFLEVGLGLDITLALVYFDENGQRIGHSMIPGGRNVAVNWPAEVKWVQVGVRILGSGSAELLHLSFKKKPTVAHPPLTTRDSLVVTNNYPTYESLYQNAFVASRVRRYRDHDYVPDVLCVHPHALSISYREFEGTEVLVGNKDNLRVIADQNGYQDILIHFLKPDIWEALRTSVFEGRITVWVHGVEAQPWWRRSILYPDDASRQIAAVESEKLMGFWRQVLAEAPSNWHFVFVSKWLAESFFEDTGYRLGPNRYSVIHNVVDDGIFDYVPKPSSQRFKVLSIRPYSSKIYANDLAVESVLALQKSSPNFEKFEFYFYGDGRLFEDTLHPLEGMSNVHIYRKFLDQREIADLHKEFGVFLVPSRMDTQGVSRGEAMASGLVPISNKIAAIPEFVDEASGILIPAEDAEGIAQAIQQLGDDPDLFLKLSRGAAKRARLQLSEEQTIQRELQIVGRNFVQEDGI